MARTDAFGYDLTIGSSAALAAWDRTVAAFMAHSAATPVHMAEALEHEPDFAMAHAAKGFFMLLLGRAELNPTAHEAHDTAARIVAQDGTARERGYVEALGHYRTGDLPATAERLERVMADHPRDGFAMKLVQSIRFVLGDGTGMRRSIEAVQYAYDADHPSAAYLNGCYAFTLEETGDYRAAEARGRDAVLRAPDDAWGIHAVAHVFDMTNRTREGVTWLANQPEAWAHCNNFRYHVWWHLALFHLEQGDHAEVLRLYDTEIRAEHTDDYRDISNGASLLVRLELEGVDVGARWEELAQLCAARTEDGCVVFADLHYMLALGHGDAHAKACRLLQSMKGNARKGTTMGKVSSDVGVPAAEGLIRFAQGDYADAYGSLVAARPRMQSVGGSHAQRDVFERLTIDAALRAGMLDEARLLLDDRTRARGALDGYAERRLSRIGAFESAMAASL